MRVSRNNYSWIRLLRILNIGMDDIEYKIIKVKC